MAAEDDFGDSDENERDPHLETILDQVVSWFARNRTEKHWRVLLAVTYSQKWQRWTTEARNLWFTRMETLLADEDRIYTLIEAIDSITEDPLPDYRYARMVFQALAWEAFTTCFIQGAP